MDRYIGAFEKAVVLLDRRPLENPFPGAGPDSLHLPAHSLGADLLGEGGAARQYSAEQVQEAIVPRRSGHSDYAATAAA